MAAIVDYATLTSEIGAHMKRSYASGDTDGFIGNAEGEFRLYLGPNFAKEASTTLSVSSGSVSLPAGLVRVLGVTHATYGRLTETSVVSVRERRVWDVSGVPDEYAVTGSTMIFGPSFTDNVTLDYEGTLTGLSSGNTTNWLVLAAPQAYLKMCLSYAHARLQSYDQAAALRQAALGDLHDLGIQSNVAQYGQATVRIPGATP